MTVNNEIFTSFEEELERLHQMSSVKPPATPMEPSVFFRRLPSWLKTSGRTRKCLIMLPEPTLNLSSPYPREELILASAAARGTPWQNISDFAEEFGLDPDLLDKPTTVLSGGERMLLCLGKAALLAAYSDGLYLCSPYFWLDPRNRKKVVSVLRAHDNYNSNANLYLLEGEGASVDIGIVAPLAVSSLKWELKLVGLKVTFPAVHFPRRSPEKILRFESESELLALDSPTLVQGPNGVGKTTLARCLAGLVAPSEGYSQAITGGFFGTARLVIQDTLLQLFAEDITGHMRRVFRYSQKKYAEAMDLFEDMQRQCAAEFERLDSGLTVGELVAPSTVLQAKLALVAERLVSRSPLLILDEPGWCLSLTQARTFVTVVAENAHQMGTAVVLISHQADWWNGLVADVLEISRGEESVEVRRVGVGGSNA